MQFYSTNNPQLRLSLRDAVLQGLPADNGLFMPVDIPRLPDSFFQQIKSYSFPDLAFEVAHALLGDSIPGEDLRKIIDGAVNFDAPLVPLEEHIGILELYHGPTLAFKDFGARFMARLMGYFVQKQTEELYILVATSGDTGGAVASGFYKTPGIKVVVLYPSGKVSHLQELQLTTLGENITALEIEGTFDDCQALVKQAFLDPLVQGHLQLTSANSINISRLIPQMFYYFRAFQQLPDKAKKISVCIPSGNFGNLTAGLMAKKMGLAIDYFVAATNLNDVVPAYLKTGIYSPRASQQTISNAMDVGKPSNFVRMLDLYQHDWEKLNKDIVGFSFNDEQTREAILTVFREKQYLLDPHGAVGYMALTKHLAHHPDQYGILLETAHPSKFLDVVEPVIRRSVAVPERLARLTSAEKVSQKMSIQYSEFQKFLLQQG